MSTISWFEIPTSDIDRAQIFYETIFGIKMVNMDNTNLQMRLFPVEDMNVDITGSIVYHKDFYIPSDTIGPLIYLNANPDVQSVLDKVEAAGGKIYVQKTQISPEFGFMGVIIDTEGNRVGLHSIS